MLNFSESNELLDFTTDTLAQAGEIVVRYFNRPISVSTKSSEVDIVTQADLETEAFIVQRIQERYPHHSILAEEQGASGSSSSMWVIDPIDGTTNFAHSYPAFMIAIAHIVHTEVVLAATYDPVRKEMFTAIRGNGAKLNNVPISVSNCSSLSSSIVATGFPYNRATTQDNNLRQFGNVMPKVQGIRRSGSAALDLAYVACGRLDGYWEYKLKLWDCAGGILMVEEAGGKVSTSDGSQWNIQSESTVATNSYIHGQLLNLIQE